MLTSTLISMLQRELRTGEKLVVAAAGVRLVVVWSLLFRQMIQDASLVLFTAVCSIVGFSFIHFVAQQSLLLHVSMFEIDLYGELGRGGWKK